MTGAVTRMIRRMALEFEEIFVAELGVEHHSDTHHCPVRNSAWNVLHALKSCEHGVEHQTVEDALDVFGGQYVQSEQVEKDEDGAEEHSMAVQTHYVCGRRSWTLYAHRT